MVQDWDIKPRQDSCSECKTAFEDNQACSSALAFGQEGYARADYCDKCWEQKGNTIQAFSVWSGIFKKPPPPAEEPLKKENAEELLRRLMTNEDPTKINVIYILAVMLERKRILVEKDIRTRDDGMLIRVYEHKKSGETFLVPDPKLGFSQLAQVQQEVSELLGVPKKPATALTEAEQSAKQDQQVSATTDQQKEETDRNAADDAVEESEEQAEVQADEDAGEAEMTDDEDADEFDEDDEEVEDDEDESEDDEESEED